MIAYLLAHNRYLNLVGIVVVLALAVLFSRKRSAINGWLVAKALLLQLAIGFLVLRTSGGSALVHAVAQGVYRLYRFAEEGIGFVFGSLADAQGPWGFVFAIKVLPIILFFGALTAVLFYYGIIQRCVGAVNYCIRPLLGTSGPETVCASANSFLGQTEAPLLIRNYLKTMTKSEMLVVMVSGMATISGAILVVFVAMGVPATHLLAASVMSVPGAIMIAKILLPESSHERRVDEPIMTVESPAQNVFDALAMGTLDGLQLALNVGAMLITFLSLLAMVNFGLSYLTYGMNLLLAAAGIALQIPALSLGLLFGYLFAPFGYLLGFTGHEIFAAGQLLGIKVAVNELIAYQQMLGMHLHERTLDIMTYALCGFSNFSCIGIQIGGIGALVPEKRVWLTELGLYAVLGGALSNILTAMIASLLL